jgi:hypothetical protein
MRLSFEELLAIGTGKPKPVTIPALKSTMMPIDIGFAL